MSIPRQGERAGEVTVKSEQFISIAQQVADQRPGFFETKGPGKGDKDTNSFMAELRHQAQRAFGKDFSEQMICGESNLAVDFFFSDEGTIVEIALSLPNPRSEFERDILKAIMAKEQVRKVRDLVFLSKPGAIKRHRQPSSQAIVCWLERNYDIKVSIRELSDNHPH